MTFCLGVRLAEGLVGIADTRVTSGNETISARKLTTFTAGRNVMFVMTAGLRSVRDKTLTYFEEEFDTQGPSYHRLYHAVNAFAAQLKRVEHEDRRALEAGGVAFDFTCLIGGQMEDDVEPHLYLLYAQGNWVEIAPGTPYQIIGVGGYGKPVLDRTLKFSDTMRLALKVGMLSFDSTRVSSNDVDFPVDVVLYRADSFRFAEHRYERDEVAEVSKWWQEHLRAMVHDLPSGWMDVALAGLPGPGEG